MMSYRLLSLTQLRIHRANDRHGELENETAAIAWLFANHENQMRNLAKDIVANSGIFEPPLVHKEGDIYTVYDGNRRTSCLKLLASPKRAPNAELQSFFKKLRAEWLGNFPSRIRCQVEQDRDRIDDILFRRHTGSQNGVGQSTWDGRMKTTFINRTGKGDKINVADEIEKELSEADMLPKKGKIPRSNVNRLLSAEAFRNRLGISVTKGKFQYIRKKDAALRALSRVADDLASKRITLDDVWDVDRKSAYLDKLESEGVLPTAADALDTSKQGEGKKGGKAEKPSRGKAKKSPKRTTLIPQEDFGVAWAGRLQRHRAIWEELQFNLELEEHPNAIAVLCRVLLELSADNYIRQAKLTTATEKDALVKKLVKCAENLQQDDKIDKRYLEVIRKARTMDEIISVDTLNKYVHSSSLAPTADHLTSIWDAFSELVVHFLNE